MTDEGKKTERQLKDEEAEKSKHHGTCLLESAEF